MVVPQQAASAAAWGDTTPLHVLVQNAAVSPTPEMVQPFLDACPGAALCKDAGGRTAVFLLCQQQQSAGVGAQAGAFTQPAAGFGTFRAEGQAFGAATAATEAQKTRQLHATLLQLLSANAGAAALAVKPLTNSMRHAYVICAWWWAGMPLATLTR